MSDNNGTSVTCPRCGNQNPKDGKFCNACGSLLNNWDSVVDESIHKTQQALSQLADREIERIEQNAKIYEIEMRERFQEKSLSWARRAFFAVGLSVAILGFFGYKETTSMNQAVQNFQNEVQNSRAAISQMKQNLDDHFENMVHGVEEQRLELDELKEKIAQLDIANAKLELDKLEEKMKLHTSNAKRIVKEAQNVNAAAKRMTNSIFDISVQLEAPHAEWNNLRSVVIEALTDKGFLIEGNNFLEVSVDESEVIYFDPAALQQAKEISTALKPQFRSIKVHEIYRPDRGRQQIVVKLKK